MRDENGFKMHTQSESHVRQMLLVGEDPKKYINDYSNQFQRDFLQLLRTSHGEKMVHINHFYQEYIHNKEHIHMNATKWLSLTEYARHLARENICRVEENDKGIHISWIDNSPEKLRRREAIRNKERLDKNDEEREQALIREQVKRAKLEAEKKLEVSPDEVNRELKREGGKIKLSFSAKILDSKGERSNLSLGSTIEKTTEQKATGPTQNMVCQQEVFLKSQDKAKSSTGDISAPDPNKASLSSKPKNIFVAVKKNAAIGKKSKIEQPRKISEAERIMRDETDQRSKRRSKEIGNCRQKKQKLWSS